MLEGQLQALELFFGKLLAHPFYVPHIPATLSAPAMNMSLLQHN
jgi:hypothetical protein